MARVGGRDINEKVILEKLMLENKITAAEQKSYIFSPKRNA